MKCRHCGYQNHDKAPFCTMCKAVLQRPTVHVSAPDPGPTPAPARPATPAASALTAPASGDSPRPGSMQPLIAPEAAPSAAQVAYAEGTDGRPPWHYAALAVVVLAVAGIVVWLATAEHRPDLPQEPVPDRPGPTRQLDAISANVALDDAWEVILEDTLRQGPFAFDVAFLTPYGAALEADRVLALATFDAGRLAEDFREDEPLLEMTRTAGTSFARGTKWPMATVERCDVVDLRQRHTGRCFGRLTPDGEGNFAIYAWLEGNVFMYVVLAGLDTADGIRSEATAIAAWMELM